MPTRATAHSPTLAKIARNNIVLQIAQVMARVTRQLEIVHVLVQIGVVRHVMRV